jgi:hypothetical protein
MNQSKFVKYHVPCPECKSTDACSINEDGSAKCFSCDAFFPKYSNGTVMSTENYNKPTPTPKVLNAHGGIFAKLTDRNISKETAEKFGVKVVIDNSWKGGKVSFHYSSLDELDSILAKFN